MLLVPLLLLHLPLELLYRAGGTLLYLSPLDLALDAALLALLYGGAAAAWGVAGATLAALLEPRAPRAAAWTVALLQLLALALVALALAWLGFQWWKGVRETLGLDFRLGRWKFVLVALVVALLLRATWRHGLPKLMDAVAARLAGGRGATLVILGVALFAVVASGRAAIQPFGWVDAPRAAPAGPSPNVILIVIDTVSAKDMSLYGAPLETTPALKAFAGRSFVFDNFFAASNYTTPSMVSLLTGRDLTAHKVYHLDGRLAPEARGETLPALLAARGYRAGAAIANSNAHPLNTRTEAGFDYLSAPLFRLPAGWANSIIALPEAKLWPGLRDDWWGPYLLQSVRWRRDDGFQRSNPYPPDLVSREALTFAQAAGAPFFLWAHYLPPHDPYLAPAPFHGRFLEPGRFDTWRSQVFVPGGFGLFDPQRHGETVDGLHRRYAEALAYADDEVGRLLQALERSGRLDDSIVVITSDHGESFEKGYRGHSGPLLHDALIRVPMLIHLPGQTSGARIADYAGHVDLLPTILELAGAPVPDWAQGRSLAPLLRGELLPPAPAFSMFLQKSSRYAPPGRGTLAVLDRPYKLVHYLDESCETLHDLERDPDELADLDASNPAIAARLRELLARRTGLALRAPADPAAPCDPLSRVAVDGK